MTMARQYTYKNITNSLLIAVNHIVEAWKFNQVNQS